MTCNCKLMVASSLKFIVYVSLLLPCFRFSQLFYNKSVVLITHYKHCIWDSKLITCFTMDEIPQEIA